MPTTAMPLKALMEEALLIAYHVVLVGLWLEVTLCSLDEDNDV